MIGWLGKKLKRKSAYEAMCDRLREHNQCPVCDSKDAMLSGPEGGASINICCRFCGTRLNMTDMFGYLYLDWTHGPQDPTPAGEPQTVFPDEDIVTLAQVVIEQKEKST